MSSASWESLTRSACLQAKSEQQTFYLVVNMVQKKPVEQLVAKLRAGKTIQRDRVIQDSKE